MARTRKASSPPALKPRTVLQGEKATYKIVSLLAPPSGRGVTYTARTQAGAGELVVVKTPSIDPSRSFEDIQEFLDLVDRGFRAEYQASESLRGLRCAAAVRDVGTTTKLPLGSRKHNLPFLVQQHIPGMTMRDYIKVSGPCEKIDDWSRLAAKLAQALADVHARGVVHGDLWPPNIILRKRKVTSSPPRLSQYDPVLIDFGESVLVDLAFDWPGSSGLSSPYAAPERRSPDRRWHYPADVYALGGTMLFLATGQDPWNDPIADRDEVHQAVVKALQTYNSHLLTQNEGIVHVIGRCLRADQQHRSLSPEAVLQDLETFFPPERHRVLETAEQVVSEAATLQKKSGSLLFAAMASVRLRASVRELSDMTRGLFHVAGDHNAIITSLCQALSVLRRGDLYLTVTVPSFWWPDNIGIMGRFYTMNMEIAKRGVRVLRVFILTKDDERHPHFKEIMEAQVRLHRRFNKTALRSAPRIDDQGVTYYCGFVKWTVKQREEMIDKGDHFGIWRAGSQSLLVVPYYAEPEKTLAGMRFWMCPPGNVDRQLQLFTKRLADSSPITTYRSLKGSQ